MSSSVPGGLGLLGMHRIFGMEARESDVTNMVSRRRAWPRPACNLVLNGVENKLDGLYKGSHVGTCSG